MVARPCLDCGALTDGGRCTVCRRAGWRRRQRTRPSTTEAGYGADHQRLRKAIARQLAEQGSVPCWRCGQLIVHGMAWDLGHDDHDRSIVRGAEHRACNRATATTGRATAARRLRGRGQRQWITSDQP